MCFGVCVCVCVGKGGKVRIQKRWAFASRTTIRSQFARVKFKGQNDINPDVVQEHIDLGGHLGPTRRRTGTTLTNRMKEAPIDVRDIAHLPGSFSNKNMPINTKHIPRAIYGAWTAPGTWAVVDRLRSAIADSYVGKGNGVKRHTRSVIPTFYANSADLSSTADPWNWIFRRRAFDIRRVWVKRPHLGPNILDIIQSYHRQARPGTQVECLQRAITTPRGRAIKEGSWI